MKTQWALLSITAMLLVARCCASPIAVDTRNIEGDGLGVSSGGGSTGADVEPQAGVPKQTVDDQPSDTAVEAGPFGSDFDFEKGETSVPVEDQNDDRFEW
jgi:hypothetical protein